ncbi:MAG: TRAP transporter substrate-binding protein DctP [Desulfatibacillaceae bacterium]|nr:TRAP transporter substrate-binding protein DctP [Desulfatibacillaceae bacterium]
MFFNLLRFFAGLCLAVLFVAPPHAAHAQSPASSNFNAEFVWHFATIIPREMQWGVQYRNVILPALQEVTDNKLWVKIYWNGIQGSDQEVIEKLNTGKLQGAGFDARGTSLVCPEFSVLQLPFLFENYQEVDFIREKMGDSFEGFLSKRSLTLALWLDQDFDQIYSTRWALSEPGLFARTTFLNWNGPLEKRVIELLGGKAMPVAIDQAVGHVKRGEADSGIAPAIWIVGAQLYGELRYIVPVPIRYAPAAVVIANSSWEMLPTPYYEDFLGYRKDMETSMNLAIRQDNEKCLEAMARYGCAILQPSPASLAVLKQRTRPVWQEMAGALYPQALLDEVLAHLEDFRASVGQNAQTP